MGTLRITTYNIHHAADGNGHPTIDDITHTLTDLDPDIVCLQEVDDNYSPRSNRTRQPTQLARRLGMTAHFLPTIRTDTGGYGNALLTRLPTADEHHLTLPTRDTEENRGALHTRLTTPDGDLHVITTHLNYQPWDGAYRTRQLTAVTELIHDVRTRHPAPVVLAGDFNAPPRRSELTAAKKLLTDSWRHTHDGPFARWLPWLAGRAPGGTFPTPWPIRRIDYVFAGFGITATAADVGNQRGSDHRPLTVDLRRTAE